MEAPVSDPPTPTSAAQPPPASIPDSLRHTQHNVTPNHIQLPKQLESVKAAQVFPLTRHRWNTNEEIASILIAFSRHADWQYHEVKLRPPSGCLLLFNRNAVRYRKDGYCWKKRKDGKTIREDHMKLKVQGLECIYGSYVHSAILPTFHRRCYWLLQNPDIVLVHYLNVPYPNNTKLSIPVMSFAMEKKEWTKQELIDQLTPMFSSLDGKRLSALDETILTLVQRLIENQDKHKQELRDSKCAGVDCDPATHTTSVPGGGGEAQLPIQPDMAKCVPGAGQDLPGLAGSSSAISTALLQQMKDAGGRLEVGQAPLILNLGNLTSGHVMLVTGGHNTGTHLSILTNTTSSSSVSQAGGTQAGSQVGSQAGPRQQQQPAWGALPLSCQQVAQLSTLTGGGQAEQLAALLQGTSQTTHTLNNSQSPQQHMNIQALHALNNTHSSQGQVSIQASQGLINSQASHRQINIDSSHGQVHSQPLQVRITSVPSSHGHMTSPMSQGQMQVSQGQMKQESITAGSGQASCCMCTGGGGRQPEPGRAQCESEAGPSGSCARSLSVQQMETSCPGGSAPPAVAAAQATVKKSLLESLCQEEVGSSGSQAVDNLDTLVGDLNLELMTTYKELPGDDSSRRAIEHMGDSFESLQASLNLDHLDLLDIPELDKICTDISASSAGQGHEAQVTQGCEAISKGSAGGALHTNTCTTDFTHLQMNSEMNSVNANGILIGQQGLGLQPYNVEVCKGGAAAVTEGQMCAAMTTTYQGGEGEVTGSLAMITDFCPDWTFTEGETKVLVTGPWHQSAGTYTILLDGKVLATTLVQHGVLRCFVPRHACGYMTLQVACDGRPISNSVMFEYKEKPVQGQPRSDPQPDWFSVGACKLQDELTDKLEQLDTALSKGPHTTAVRQILCNLVSGEDQDICLARHLEATMSGRVWMTAGAGELEHGSMGLSLLHLAAALGYHRFIKALIRWRSERPSWQLEYEVDAHSTDTNCCTPLMWACARGHTDAAICLYKWNKGPLHSFNGEGNLPLIVARQHGHHKLAETLEQLDRSSSSQPSHIASTGANTGASMGANTGANHGARSHTPQRPVCSHINATVSTRSTPEKASFSSDFPIATSTPTIRDNQTSAADLFKSPQAWCVPEKCLGDPLHIDIPARESSPTHTISQQKRETLARRQSDQMLSLASSSMAATSSTSALTPAERRQKLKKRLSVDILPYEKSEPAHYSPTRTFQRPIREANSEPHLSANMEHLLCESNPMLPQGRELGSPEMLMQTEGSEKLGQGSSTAPPPAPHIDRMDTDELSDSSGNSFVDVEKLSSDDEELGSNLNTGEDSENPSSQMVHLAKQIIAAMPERIKSSPSRSDDPPAEESVRERSSSYGSLQSTSPHASSSYSEALSSYGDDSGICTPMRDSLAFDEYRYSEVYSDLGTPASSLSPDSTCLQHSPYSPYSFQLDSPPPTAAEFIEYFNAPATFMEKDFSQLTLSDLEQRKLYEAAKVIQSAYRQYKDKQCKQQAKQIEAAILIQSYYRRYKQYAYYKKMTQAAVLIQSQFRSYYAQKRFKKSRDAAVVIQNQYRSYKEHERLKKGGNKTVVQRYRSHYQRKAAGSGKGSRVVQIVPEGTEGSQVETANPVIEECPQDTSSNVTNLAGGSGETEMPDVDPYTRLLVTAACHYSRAAGLPDSASRFCPAYSDAMQLPLSGEKREKLAAMSAVFCSSCQYGDDVCDMLFCEPSLLMVEVAMATLRSFCETIKLTDPGCHTQYCSGVQGASVRQADHEVEEPDLVCIAAPTVWNITAMDQWCAQMCNHGYNNQCTQTLCTCTTREADQLTTGCSQFGPTPQYHSVPGMATWCERTCSSGYCPSSHCRCADLRHTQGQQTSTSATQSTPSATQSTPSSTTLDDTSVGTLSTTSGGTSVQTKDVDLEDKETGELEVVSSLVCEHALIYQQQELAGRHCGSHNTDEIESFAPQLLCALSSRSAPASTCSHMFCGYNPLAVDVIRSAMCSVCQQFSQQLSNQCQTAYC